jgi:hypothetical protein
VPPRAVIGGGRPWGSITVWGSEVNAWAVARAVGSGVLHRIE